MRIIRGTVSGASRLARLQAELSKKARQRLKWFDQPEISPDMKLKGVFPLDANHEKASIYG